MKIVGPMPFERDEKGVLKTRVGTLFLRTPGLVTTKSVHAMQRMMWVMELNKDRIAAHRPPLAPEEIEAEMADSVDLLFDDKYVLIRPAPQDMGTALRGDELLQTIISKRKIRYLNIQNKLVRDALRMRGEAWRMRPIPLYEEEIRGLIESSKTAIEGNAIYYYNRLTGTRFLTLASFRALADYSPAERRKHLVEISRNLQTRNRFANPEVAFFPPDCGMKAETFAQYDFEQMDDDSIWQCYQMLLCAFEASVPKPLWNDDLDNADWRRALSEVIVHAQNETELTSVVEGLSPEFFMQIEWMPGGRIVDGELMFDTIFDELERHPEDQELVNLCDFRARAILLNYLREYANIDYVNIGRTRRSLSHRTGQGPRAYVYIVELKESNSVKPIVRIIRLQRWTIASHLDEGKSLQEAIVEAEEYADYVMDRRLGCRQLGMKLPSRMSPRHFREFYRKDNLEFYVWTGYFERDYIAGRATDKLPVSYYNNPDFNKRFARLLGRAAASNLIVGRATLNDKRTLFDDGDEVLILDRNQLPEDMIVSEPTGAFSNYTRAYVDDLPVYANAMLKRRDYMPNFEQAVGEYLLAFEREYLRIQSDYRARQKAFDLLFKDRPLDPLGSVAYRWRCVLNRLALTEVNELSRKIRDLIWAEL